MKADERKRKGAKYLQTVIFWCPKKLKSKLGLTFDALLVKRIGEQGHVANPSCGLRGSHYRYELTN